MVEPILRGLRRRAGLLIPAALVALAVPAAPAGAQNTIPAAGPECDEATLGAEELVLVFSKTAGFRHDSIDEGIAAVCELAGAEGIAVDATEDAANFTAEPLGEYDAVVFLSTTGDVLNAEQQAAFEAYIQGGGGFAGIHAASDTEYDWPWYGDLVGAYFQSHQRRTRTRPSRSPTTTTPRRPTCRSAGSDSTSGTTSNRTPAGTSTSSRRSTRRATRRAPARWARTTRRPGATRTTAGDPGTRAAGIPPSRTPSRTFRGHILGGIQWAAGLAEGECGGTIWDNFQKTTLAQGASEAGEPIGLTVMPDRSVLHTSRDGTLFHTDADGNTHVAAEIPVYSYEEDGLQALTLDPAFEENNWVYIYYSPELDTPPGEAPHDGVQADWEPYQGANYLSRFKWDPAAEELDLTSEQILLEVDQDRGMCCHLGGDFAWDPAGNLYLSTGDDTDPFESAGYTPIDERPNRNPAYDAQRILGEHERPAREDPPDQAGPDRGRLHDPRGQPFRGRDGRHPAGDLRDGLPEPVPDRDRPRHRLPLRRRLRPRRRAAPIPPAGPGGQVEFNVVREAGFYGWPYCTGDNDAYLDYDFATGVSGDAFDCDAPVNESPRNTGLTELPPVIQPDIWYGFDSPWDAEMQPGGSESPMGGAVYRFDPDNPSSTKLPEHFDGHWFLGEWGRGWIKETALDSLGGPLEVSDFVNTPEHDVVRVMDMEIGPDGALYVLDYGTGSFNGTPESAVHRFDYVEGAPQVSISADPTQGEVPLDVTFTSDASDPDGGELEYSWDFGDGETSDQPNPVHTYTEPGTFEAALTVTDEDGNTASDSIEIDATDCGPGPVDPSDEFDGTALDECRWSEIVRDNPGQRRVADGALHIDTGNGTDMYGGNTNAENLVLQPAPEGAWEAITQVDMPFTGKDYEQAGLMVYADDDNFVKLSYIKVPGTRNMEFMLNDEGEPVDGGAADRTPNFDAGFPTEVYLRVRSDGTNLTAAYSLNGTDWNEFGRERALAALGPDVSVGLAAFNGDGSGNEASFESFSLEPVDVEPTCTEPEQPDPGFEMLFDGTEASFAEWQMAGPGGFNFTSDCTLESFGGLGMLYHPQLFESPATFRMEWMMPGDENSGVFVGNWEPDPEYLPNPAWDAVDHGYEIQIDATDDADSTTGAIYNFQAPDAAARDAALNPPGEWNAYEITVDDPVVEVRLNGTLINQFTSTDPARDLSATKLGIQNHGAGDEVYFRRIQVATPDAGAAELDLEVTPSRRSVKPGREGTFRATLRNTGDAAADGVRLCATAPRSKAAIVGRDCTVAGTLEPGDSLRDAIAVKAKRSAAGDRIRVRVTAEGANAGRVSETVTLKVKKKKRKRGR